MRVRSLRSDLLAPFAPELRIFGVAALAILLLGCANISSLLLARGVGRSKEIAVRMALGAGRLRVVRLLLTESLLLALAGAAAGVVLAAALLRLAVVAAPPWLELHAMLSVSPTLAAFSVALALTVGVLTGLWPAVRGSRADLGGGLKESGSALVSGRRQMRSLDGLVVFEIALALVLLSFAGLLAKSFILLAHTDLGYRADHLVTFRMPLPGSRYRTEEAQVQFWDNLRPRILAVPGVISASSSNSIPLGGTYSGMDIEIQGDAARHEWRDVMVRAAEVTPDYFGTLGIGLHAGRGFLTTDTAGSEPVVVVNEALVRKLMRGRSALGTLVRMPGNEWRRIVGVISDTRYNGAGSAVGPELYAPFAQEPWLEFVSVRTAVPEAAVMTVVRREVRKLDPMLAITQVRTLREAVDQSNSVARQMMLLVLGFAAVGLALSTLGLGGVMAYAVSRRRREIGLRMALGAGRGDVAWGVLAGAARLLAAGTVVGIVGALAGGRVLGSLLYGVRPYDPAVLAAAAVVLAGVALAACLAPARRAAAVEPMAALRQE